MTSKQMEVGCSLKRNVVWSRSSSSQARGSKNCVFDHNDGDEKSNGQMALPCLDKVVPVQKGGGGGVRACLSGVMAGDAEDRERERLADEYEDERRQKRASYHTHGRTLTVYCLTLCTCA